MEKPVKFDSIQPRFLRYRSHYKITLVSLLTLAGLILAFWGHRFTQSSWQEIYSQFHYEMWISLAYFVGFGCFYFFWLRHRLNRSVQVYPTHVCVHNGRQVDEIQFSDVESVGVVCWSIFYCKTKDGIKHYFSSGLERVDYIWDGLHACRPELFSEKEYEEFRLKLVQYDHHQKRKEWFFRHKLVDVFNWCVLPLCFLMLSYAVQTQNVVVHQHGLYFFRLFMYSLLIMLITTFFFSMVLKKFIFDKKIKIQMSAQPDDKLRDIEFEGIVMQRSKMMQMITACFIFALVIRSEANLFSVTKVKDNLANFHIKSGHTLVVDNRFNCVNCKYSVKDGDLVVFGRGTVGQIMAKEGDMVGHISQDRKGRVIASEQIQEVPAGHVAIRLADGNDIVMVKVQELIGRIQK